MNTERLVIRPADDVGPAILEDDESLRLRAQNAFNLLTVAGPRSQYEALGRAVDGNIADVSAISESPAEVTITVLTRDGDGTADSSLLAKVESALSEEDRRPIGDRLLVQAASVHHYNITATLHIPHGPESEPIIQEAIRRLSGWTERRELGNSVRTSHLISLLHATGVRYVEVSEPAADIVINRMQYAICDSINISVQVSHD